MSKYDDLGAFLAKKGFAEIPMTFAEIEQVTGQKLPPKAQHHRAWWSNNPSNNVMTKIWLKAGYQTERVDMSARKLVFKRAAKSGMGEAPRGFEGAENAGEKKPRRSPLFGALKGTFTIEPGWDLTRPALDPEDLEYMEANIERTADMIDEGISSKKR
ncbi:MAG TPA: hypothetical protein VHW02_13340 [Rhizomicrobium sp.]|jgi:hypothetical protein|nr:hypothetical protein [Rhizomicrobium sp.]